MLTIVLSFRPIGRRPDLSPPEHGFCAHGGRRQRGQVLGLVVLRLPIPRLTRVGAYPGRNGRHPAARRASRASRFPVLSESRSRTRTRTH